MPIDRSTSWQDWPRRPAPSVVLRVMQERPKPDPATFIGGGKVASLAAACAEADVDVVDLRQRADAGTAATARGEARAQGRRSHAADSRHLRAAGADPRGQVAGGAGAAQVPAAASRRHRAPRCRASAAASARVDRVRPSSRPIAGGSARGSRPIQREIDQVRQRRTQLRERRQQAVGADGRARRLYERRQDDAVQPPDERTGGRVRRALRDARSAGPPGAAAGSTRAARVGHGRFHRSPAARAGRRVPRDARRGGGSRSGAARHRCRRRRSATARSPRCAGCSRRSARRRSLVIDVYNKVDTITADERRRIARTRSRPRR